MRLAWAGVLRAPVAHFVHSIGAASLLRRLSVASCSGPLPARRDAWVWERPTAGRRGTHNTNMPVLGDAELTVALESNGTTAGPADSGIGSLDTPRVRQLTEEILEGGREVFEARQHVYGF